MKLTIDIPALKSSRLEMETVKRGIENRHGSVESSKRRENQEVRFEQRRIIVQTPIPHAGKSHPDVGSLHASFLDLYDVTVF